MSKFHYGMTFCHVSVFTKSHHITTYNYSEIHMNRRTHWLAMKSIRLKLHSTWIYYSPIPSWVERMSYITSWLGQVSPQVSSQLALYKQRNTGSPGITGWGHGFAILARWQLYNFFSTVCHFWIDLCKPQWESQIPELLNHRKQCSCRNVHTRHIWRGSIPMTLENKSA